MLLDGVWSRKNFSQGTMTSGGRRRLYCYSGSSSLHGGAFQTRRTASHHLFNLPTLRQRLVHPQSEARKQPMAGTQKIEGAQVVDIVGQVHGR